MSNMMPIYGLVICLILVVLIIIPFWFIFSKAGYSKWLSLLMVVPIINVVMLYFLAFSAWPSQRETQRDDAEVPMSVNSRSLAKL
jgi:hypothetical protein